MIVLYIVLWTVIVFLGFMGYAVYHICLLQKRVALVFFVCQNGAYGGD